MIWINVNDSLPTINEWVLVWSQSDDGHCLAKMLGKRNKKPNWYVVPKDCLSFKSVLAVTYWMALPPAPHD